MKKGKLKKIKVIFLSILLILLILILVFLFIKLRNFFLESPLFRIKRIKTNLSEDISLSFLGKNIFSVDIKAVSSQLTQSYPQYKEVVVKRVFPDTLSIEFIKRLPLFQIKVKDRFWIVDEELIVISGPQEEEFAHIPLVNSSLNRNLEIYLGKEIFFPYAKEIVSLIKELKTKNFFKDFEIPSIFSYTLNDIHFNLNKIDIRIGPPPYKRKLKILKEMILPRFYEELERIAYIDLRFKDPVIGYRR